VIAPALESASATVTVRKPFTLFSTATSHGWYQTLPFRWDNKRGKLLRAEQLMDRRVMLLEIEEQRSAKRGWADVLVNVTGEGAADAGIAQEMARRVSVMLHLDEDLRGFYALCRKRPEMKGALRWGAGRCMRASSLWEDVVKTILGTNVLWKQAVVMINRLAQLGEPCSADPTLKAWPSARRVVRAGEPYLRDVVRAGYRAPYIIELAQAQKSGALDFDAIEAQSKTMHADELFKTLTKLKGIGKSSAHFLMNLLGHYDHISVDSATYAYAKRKLFRGKRPTEKQIRKRFAEFGRWQSLVYWFGRWSPKLEWWEDASGRASM
jgi:3-methyladenine DNA glycosylase/8-oxoguanine DNA glycosylase